MIAVFTKGDEIIVVGLNADNTPVDIGGTLFGNKSVREIKEYSRIDVDTDRGQIVHMRMSANPKLCTTGS